MIFSTVAVATLAFASQVAAHGYVPTIKINGQTIPGWNVQSDPYANPVPARVVRRTPNDSGFVPDPTSKDITCSIGNYLPTSAITATVAAGQSVTIQWNTWPVGHYGPIMNYMAKCPGSCSTWKGDSGSPWFKISQLTYNGEWPSDTLAKSGFSHTVKIPSSIAPGEYLLRHEMLALHGASNVGGAQFYPVCVQLTVTGGGSKVPSGLAFPGAYSKTDKGILFNPYQGDAANRAYVPPGGPVYAGL